jgi:hypothetical protein
LHHRYEWRAAAWRASPRVPAWDPASLPVTADMVPIGSASPTAARPVASGVPVCRSPPGEPPTRPITRPRRVRRDPHRHPRSPHRLEIANFGEGQAQHRHRVRGSVGILSHTETPLDAKFAARVP